MYYLYEKFLQSVCDLNADNHIPGFLDSLAHSPTVDSCPELSCVINFGMNWDKGLINT